jgi:hypothetical protein
VYALKGALSPRAHATAKRLRHRPGPQPWLSERTIGLVNESEEPVAWKRLDGPRWWAALVNSLFLVPDKLAGADELRREATMDGLRLAHPWRDPMLIAHVLRQDPETAFDPVHDRPVARRAMKGTLPDSIRLSQEKPIFNSLLEESFRGADAPLLEDLLSDPPQELDPFLDARGAAWLLERRANRAHGLDLWRLATAAQWLRRTQANSRPDTRK